jgi:predicted RNase H-like nuclease (RuvC/YqgF family)
MAELSEKIDKLTDKVHNIDKRQENFETFVRAYIESNDKTIQEMKERMNKTDERMDKMDGRMDEWGRHMQNMVWANLGAYAFGVVAIIIAVFVAR